jgi:hypothetical protein
MILLLNKTFYSFQSLIPGNNSFLSSLLFLSVPFKPSFIHKGSKDPLSPYKSSPPNPATLLSNPCQLPFLCKLDLALRKLQDTKDAAFSVARNSADDNFVSSCRKTRKK